MKKKPIEASCISCGKHNLTKNEVGINKKLMGENIETYYCLDCLADYLEVSVDDINAKIEEFKEEGCALFE
ncbi:hypothetical protein SAMN04487934_11444 [Eubacterium ruminantium]|nr:hypothetical protein SAMN04487934_11444 [Eubacterium ruminantium]